MPGLLLQLQVVKKQFNIYKEPNSKKFTETPDRTYLPQIDLVLYQYPDMAGARKEKRSPEPIAA